MLRLIGDDALSAFRQAQLRQAIQQAVPAITDIASHYEYFVYTRAALNAEELSLLSQVLSARHETIPLQENAYWVIPRLGTQSPWGSKAGDILRNVGLSTIDRIERAQVYQFFGDVKETMLLPIRPKIHDRMTETVVKHWEEVRALFQPQAPQSLTVIPLREEGKKALEQANVDMGLALSPEEIDYLVKQYTALERSPTDSELMMFAQANSEHCRHKIFKAHWEINGERKPNSLFDMIKNTAMHSYQGLLSAYHDNAAVIEGFGQSRFYCNPHDKTYRFHEEPVHILMKVETHNHPTAIEPFAGAGTGQGGEIRDEGATGKGSKPKAGLTGFSVSNLRIPDFLQSWEGTPHYPSRISTALDIMIKAPIGGAAFNNEFGRPNLCGYFRTFEQAFPSEHHYYARGYHKPVMIAGGLGNITDAHVEKDTIPPGALIIVLGGPAMKVGLGGGAASSMGAGSSTEDLDFASVQRQNPEMQRRCQEVIDGCWAHGKENPIISIHDVGAGGLANAIPELLQDSDRGGIIDLRKIPNAEPQMSPLEIWCNESQERYVLAILPENLPAFEALCQRERCPFAVVGTASALQQLIVHDPLAASHAIDIPQSLLFGNTPPLYKQITVTPREYPSLNTDYALSDILPKILACPTVADKSFLITIGDRTITGLVARDQMIGPWQVPVADCAVTATSFTTLTGEAMSMGERPLIALTNPAASARMAVAEAVLNILSADIAALSDIRLSCNWMACAHKPEEEAALYAAVEAIGMELCPAWGIAIPVGKDSLSMKTTWETQQGTHEVVRGRFVSVVEEVIAQ